MNRRSGLAKLLFNDVVVVVRTNRRMFLGLAAVAVLVSSLTLPLSSFGAQQQQTKAETFIDIAQKAYAQTVKLINQAAEKGVDVSASAALVSEGQTLLDAAKTALSTGEYTSAFEKAREAQNKLRDAVKAIPVTQVEAEEEEGQGILVAIDGAQKRIQSVKDVLRNITPTAENQAFIDAVNGNLTQAENSLAESKATLQKSPADVAAAANLLAAANKNVEDASKALKLIGDWTVTWRAESFLNGINKDVERVKGQLDSAQAKGIKVDDLNAQLTQMDKLIQNARTKLLAGDKKGALAEIKEARNTLHSITKDLAKRH